MKSIRSILLCSFLTVALLTMIVGISGIFSVQQANRTLGETMILDKAAMDAVDNARAAQVHFKTLVQEWKNILIRGNDQQLFDNHLKAFAKEYQATLDSLAANKAALTRMGADSDKVQKTIEELKQLDSRYRTALKSFDRANPDAGKVVDKLVKGIDRAATAAIDEIVAETANQAGTRQKSVAETAALDNRRATMFNIAAIVMATLLAIASASSWPAISRFHWRKRPPYLLLKQPVTLPAIFPKSERLAAMKLATWPPPSAN